MATSTKGGNKTRKAQSGKPAARNKSKAKISRARKTSADNT